MLLRLATTRNARQRFMPMAIRANTPGNSAAMIARGPTSAKEGMTPNSAGDRRQESRSVKTASSLPHFCLLSPVSALLLEAAGPYPFGTFSSGSGGLAFFARPSSITFTRSALVPLIGAAQVGLAVEERPAHTLVGGVLGAVDREPRSLDEDLGVVVLAALADEEDRPFAPGRDGRGWSSCRFPSSTPHRRSCSPGCARREPSP